MAPLFPILQPQPLRTNSVIALSSSSSRASSLRYSNAPVATTTPLSGCIESSTPPPCASSPLYLPLSLHLPPWHPHYPLFDFHFLNHLAPLDLIPHSSLSRLPPPCSCPQRPYHSPLLYSPDFQLQNCSLSYKMIS